MKTKLLLMHSNKVFPVVALIFLVMLVPLRGFSQQTHHLTIEVTIPQQCEPVVKADEQDRTFKIFPNPASNCLKLSTEKPYTLVEILSSKGQVLYRYTMTISEESLDISTLPNGVYFIKVSNAIHTAWKRFQIKR